MELDERTIAIHEAGHAVAACRMDFPFSDISIVPTRKENLGSLRTQSPYVPDEEGFVEEEFLISRAKICMAGYAAVKIIKECSEEEALVGCFGDIDHCEEILQDMDLDLEDIKESSVALLSEPNTESALEMLVKALLVLKKVNTTHVEFICDHADGLHTNEDYARYLAREYHGHKDLNRIVSELADADMDR